MNDSYLTNEGRNVPRRVEKWIRWIPLIKGTFKLNFDGSRMKDTSGSRWVIRDSNEVIKMAGNRHLSNASIITTKCMF